jgi:hypothetical protein
MADDALNCFTSLLDSIPTWISDLDAIWKAAADRQGEIRFAHHPEEPTKSPSRPVSTSSKRSKDGADNTHRSIRARMHLAGPDAVPSSPKKRKTLSVASDDQPGPCKSRIKMAVYYDGETQKQFENLVRAMGSARNSIRKGKMSAKVDAMDRTGSSSSSSNGDSEGSDADDVDLTKITSGLNYKSSRSRLPTFGRNDGTEAFDKVDAKLEKAQAMCERAAHQMLRDGDCRSEITSAQEHFTEARLLAEAELPMLQRKVDRAVARRRRSAERRRKEEEAVTRLEASKPKLDTENMTAIAATNTTAAATTAMALLAGTGKLEAEELEIDDDSDGEDLEEFDLTSIQFSKFAPMRMTRPRINIH